MPGPYIGSVISRLATEYPSARQAVRAFRAMGGQARNEYFRQAYFSARQQLANAPWAVGKDLRYRPTEEEILAEPTVRARGLAQKVVVIGRMRNGQVVTRPVQIKVGETLISRANAIRKAETYVRGEISGEADQETDLVAVYGGIHVGVVRRIPTA